MREVAYPQHARWTVYGQSPAGDGWVFARDLTTGAERSFAPGALEPLPQPTTQQQPLTLQEGSDDTH